MVYYFIYVVTESVYNVNDFYQPLYHELILSNAIKNLEKLSKGLTDFITLVVQNVEVKGVKVKEQGEADYYQLFIELLGKVDKGIGRVVIMIDEFPQTLHNIHKQHGEIEARRFLQTNRELRHHKVAEATVSFIYTGSIALFPTVEKIGSLNDVNDLQPVEVKPLSRADAKELLRLLCERRKVVMQPEAVEFMLDEIRCFIPFHIQLVYQELEDIHFDNEHELTKADVQDAIDRTVNAKNKARFEPYFSRLKTLLEVNEYLFAMDVLKFTAVSNSIDKPACFDFAQKYKVDNYKEILNSLCEDGYLFETDGTYIYTSPILQLWCKKNNTNGI